MNKFILFIAAQKGYEVLKEMYQYDNDIIGLVVTFKEKNVLESYTEKIIRFCKKNQIHFKWWKDIKQDLVKIIKEYKIAEAVAISWRFLISLNINKYLKTKLIIFHDSLLPKYRGFAPTPTAVLCGEKEVGMSVIFAEEEWDKGDIIIQKKVNIDSNMYIKDIINLQSKLYKEAIKDLIGLINNNNIKLIPQDETQATYSIWRNPEDGEIDWNLSSQEIYNKIRAISYPYTGAYTYLDNKKIYIWKAEIVKDMKFVKRDCGKIWSIDNGISIIVCGSGMLKLLDVKDGNNKKVNFITLRKKLG